MKVSKAVVGGVAAVVLIGGAALLYAKPDLIFKGDDAIALAPLATGARVVVAFEDLAPGTAVPAFNLVEQP